MRVKIPDLAGALEGRPGGHRALMCRLRLDHIGHLEAVTAKLDAQTAAMTAPFRAARDLLAAIPGIGPLAAAAVISEAGAGIRQFFPSAAHLASWAGMCPAATNRPAGAVPGNGARAAGTSSPSWPNAPGRRPATAAASSPCTAGTS